MMKGSVGNEYWITPHFLFLSFSLFIKLLLGYIEYGITRGSLYIYIYISDTKGEIWTKILAGYVWAHLQTQFAAKCEPAADTRYAGWATTSGIKAQLARVDRFGQNLAENGDCPKYLSIRLSLLLANIRLTDKFGW